MFANKLKRSKTFNSKPYKCQNRNSLESPPSPKITLNCSKGDKETSDENLSTPSEKVQQNNLEKRKSVSLDDVMLKPMRTIDKIRSSFKITKSAKNVSDSELGRRSFDMVVNELKVKHRASYYIQTRCHLIK
ncbi:hypothetical protein FQA39_LY07835 [Lamprigera yunnana]|nr:hypothetical protein FQA39_LY07835 [Lamprigera yunnana]